MQGFFQFPGRRHAGAAVMSPQLHSSLILGLLQGHEEAIKGSNFIFSPLSIRVCLGLLATMLNETDRGLLLSFVNSPTLSDLNAVSESLIDACRPSDDESVLIMSFANGVWVDRKQNFVPSFEEIAKYIYKAFIKQVDFETQYHETRNEINDWIEKETRGLIRNFLPMGTPNDETSYVLANALYFKGIWAQQFEVSNTIFDRFYLSDGSTFVNVAFMRSYSQVLFGRFAGFKSLVLHYKKDNQTGRDLSMILFLPDNRDGLLDLIKKVGSDPAFIDVYRPTQKCKVVVKIPKFELSSKFDVAPLLKKMGLHSDRLDALHGATIEVDEKGTTAAAVTVASQVIYGCSGPLPPPPPEFIADHPFLFSIREDASGAILFLGHVANPAKK